MKHTSQPQSMVQSQRDQNGTWTSIVPNQSQEISSLKLVNSQGKDVIRGIPPRFVYQFASLDYYKPMEDQEVEENIDIDVVEEIEKNYLRSFEYVEAQVNVLDEVPHSHSQQENPKLDQTKYIAET